MKKTLHGYMELWQQAKEKFMGPRIHGNSKNKRLLSMKMPDLRHY